MENVMMMTDGQKIGRAMWLSLPMLAPEARRQVEEMLTPTSIAIIGASTAAWAASHLFGVGEFLDVALLALGAVTLGAGAITTGQEFAQFAIKAPRARSESDLMVAARHFAKACDTGLITVISAVLLKQSAKTVWARGKPRLRLDFRPSSPPPPGFKPTIRFTSQKMVDSKGRLVDGSCSEYGDILIWLGNAADKQLHVLLHELGHRMLTPKISFLREFRGNLNMSAYLRSAWVQYLEEVIAEAHAGFVGKGVGEALLAFKFPIKHGYVTISQLTEEMIAVTNITIGGLKYGVYVEQIMSVMPDLVCEDQAVVGP